MAMYGDELGPPESSGTFILPILERIDEVTQRQVNTDVRLEKTLTSLLKFLEGYGGDRKGGRGGGKPNEKNPLEPKTPSSLMNVFSWMGEKKDKMVDVIKKGFFKLFKTDYFTNLFKAINNLAKAITNSFMSWLKFFLMMAFIDPSGGFLRDIINMFVDIGMMLFNIIMPLIPVAVKMMFNTIVYVFKLVLSLMPSIISAIMNTFTQLGNTFPILKPVIGFINQFLSAIRSLFVILNDPKADKGRGFQTFLNKVFAILGKIVEKVLDFVVEKAPAIFNFILNFVANTLIPALIKYVPKILDVFSEGLKGLIDKYPNLKVWLQPFKDILDMLSNYIGSFAKFDTTSYLQGIDSYKKKEAELFKQKAYQQASEEDQLKMLSNMQFAYLSQNKDVNTKMQQDLADFNKLNQDKSNMAKQKWDEFLSHILETLGKAYDSLPDSAKTALWTVALFKIGSWLFSIGSWAIENKEILKLVGEGLSKLGGWLLRLGGIILSVFKFIGSAIATFIGGLSLTTLAIISAVLIVIGLIWYFWDDITKFMSDLGKSISDWWDKLDIMGPLKRIGNTIVDFGADLIVGLYEVFIEPIIDLFKDMFSAIGDLLPDWLNPKKLFSIGGGTDADELKPKKTASVQTTISAEDMIKKLKEEEFKAESNLIKSPEWAKYEFKKKNEEYKKLATLNMPYLDSYAEGLGKNLQTSISKNPVNFVNVTATASNMKLDNTNIKLEAPKLNWDNMFSSFENFSFGVKIIMNNLIFGLKDIIAKFTIGKFFGESDRTIVEKLQRGMSASDFESSKKIQKLVETLESKGYSEIKTTDDLAAALRKEKIDETIISSIVTPLTSALQFASKGDVKSAGAAASATETVFFTPKPVNPVKSKPSK